MQMIQTLKKLDYVLDLTCKQECSVGAKELLLVANSIALTLKQPKICHMWPIALTSIQREYNNFSNIS